MLSSFFLGFAEIFFTAFTLSRSPMFLGLFNRHLTTTVAQSGNEGHGQAGNGSGGSQTGTRLSQFAQCGERARLCPIDEALRFGT